MWLIVLSLTPHHLHLHRVLTILAWICLVLMALIRACFLMDSVSSLRFPFLSHVHVLSCKIVIIIIIYSCRVFHISISWWFFTGVWVTPSNVFIWIVSTRLLTSNFSRPFNNPLVIVPKAPITVGTIVTFVFPSFFNSLARSRYLSFFSHSFSFILWSVGTTKSTILLIFFFFFSFFFFC